MVVLPDCLGPVRSIADHVFERSVICCSICLLIYPIMHLPRIFHLYYILFFP